MEVYSQPPYLLYLQLDSGSSDLVLFTNVPNAKSSVSPEFFELHPLEFSNLLIFFSCRAQGLTLNLTYGVGFAYGSISTAEVSLADLTVSSQAILVSSSFQNPVTQFGAQGIMGLGSCINVITPSPFHHVYETAVAVCGIVQDLLHYLILMLLSLVAMNPGDGPSCIMPLHSLLRNPII